MNFHNKSAEFALNFFSTNKKDGLNEKTKNINKEKYGLNIISKKAKVSFFSKLLGALCEPMILILVFSFIITFGSNLGQFFKSGKFDYVESIGIFSAIVLSVSITLIMEGSSEKAFSILNNIYDSLSVKVIREGKIIVISQRSVVVGDIILLESGDKIVADGRLIESLSLSIDESALTGESNSVSKEANAVLPFNTPLAEQKNCVFSGTYVTAGSGKMLVTSVGNNTEMGKIAKELNVKKLENSPLQHKLAILGKTITIIGASIAGLVFLLSAIRLVATNNFNVSSVRELFISTIVLVVAAVPEGLPTIVAVSLALNMIKLAKENALIKKMVATETTGAVSVICSDKTGTLTQNKMSVVGLYHSNYKLTNINSDNALLENFIINSTADIITSKNNKIYKGSGTECALLDNILLKNKRFSYVNYRKQNTICDRIPFSSQNKIMQTTIVKGNVKRLLIKGAPEKILDICNLSQKQKDLINKDIVFHQQKAQRILCFAHLDSEQNLEKGKVFNGYIFDGFVALTDPLRPEVKLAIENCKKAGVKVKILTGDNIVTAYAIARELKIANSMLDVVNASDIENLTDEQLIKALNNISVIARSTPIVKLRIVKALKSIGEVVAVTGDGINDAPAIKHADVGIAMGISGSEITKEAADIVLLDDSFATVVKAIAFGRNVYRNLQRFILFQLSVNLSALLLVSITAFMGIETPFNTLQLLWINIIMDGPPAITLGLENASDNLMNLKPIKKTQSIVSLKMLFRILFNGVFVAVVLIMQIKFNFLNVNKIEQRSVVFTIFVLFQLFNAFNSRELGSESVFKSISKNKIMLCTFAIVFVLHILIVQVFPKIFGISPLSLIIWLKCLSISFSIVVVSELYKLIYRICKKNKNLKKINKNNVGSIN